MRKKAPNSRRLSALRLDVVKGMSFCKGKNYRSFKTNNGYMPLYSWCRHFTTFPLYALRTHNADSNGATEVALNISCSKSRVTDNRFFPDWSLKYKAYLPLLK